MVVAIGTGSVIHRSYRNLFFFNDTATTEIYTLSLHDALPISGTHRSEHPSACEPRQTDRADADCTGATRSEEHTSELQSPCNLVCRLLLEKKNFDVSVHDLSAGGAHSFLSTILLARRPRDGRA